MDAGSRGGSPPPIDNTNLVIGKTDPCDPRVCLLERLTQGGIKGIHGTISIGSSFPEAFTLTNHDGCSARRRASGGITTETAIITGELKER